MEEPNISQLPYDLILKIFSFLPLYEESVATRLLTNEDPWKLELLPVVVYDDFSHSYLTKMKFMSFVYGSLLLNNDQILERLDLVLGRNYPASDINFWVKLAVKRSVRKLRITMYGNTLELPSCLSTCVTLKSLILHQVRIMVVPSCFRLPSLKSLHLLKVSFSGDESLAGLLQSCPDLEYLVVKNMLFKTVPPWFLMSSLKSLHLLSSIFSYDESVASLLQKCPVLEDLVVKDVMFKTLPPWFLMSSLKSLHLLSSSFSDDQSVASLLQKCPVLEDLVVKKTQVFDSNKCTLSSCTTLKMLTLSKLSIKVALPWSRLPLLKTLHLISVKFSSDESIASFLPTCPVLECLVVDQSKADNAMFKDVPYWFCLPSLKSLHLLSVKFSMDESVAKLIQRCPVLEDLVMNNTTDDNRAFSALYMFMFPFLGYLELCTCSAGWASLLVCILKDAPTLNYLKLKSQHGAYYKDPMLLWNKPTAVPECLSTHLEIMEWRQYEGTEQERNVAAYILANNTCLKMATFSTWCRDKHELKKLKKLNRVSETCQLLFD